MSVIAIPSGRTTIALLFLVLFTEAHTAEKLPDRWRKTMTNDPATNERLVNYATPMPDKADEAVRIMLLARTVGQACQSAAIDRAALTGFVDRTIVGTMSRRDLEAASERAMTRFNGFDYQDLAHLCAGIDHLFGKNGVLAKGLVSPGAGEPAFPYNPASPYFKIQPLFPSAG